MVRVNIEALCLHAHGLYVLYRFAESCFFFCTQVWVNIFARVYKSSLLQNNLRAICAMLCFHEDYFAS